MRFTLKKVLVSSLSIFVVGVIVFYAYFQSRAIIAGPVITLAEPKNNSSVANPLLFVSGVAIHAKELTLQGRPIFIDLDGKFSERLLLSPGYNIIELTARDAQGRQIVKDLAIVYDASSTDSITP